MRMSTAAYAESSSLACASFIGMRDGTLGEKGGAAPLSRDTGLLTQILRLSTRIYPHCPPSTQIYETKATILRHCDLQRPSLLYPELLPLRSLLLNDFLLSRHHGFHQQSHLACYEHHCIRSFFATPRRIHLQQNALRLRSSARCRNWRCPLDLR